MYIYRAERSCAHSFSFYEQPRVERCYSYSISVFVSPQAFLQLFFAPVYIYIYSHYSVSFYRITNATPDYSTLISECSSRVRSFEPHCYTFCRSIQRLVFLLRLYYLTPSIPLYVPLYLYMYPYTTLLGITFYLFILNSLLVQKKQQCYTSTTSKSSGV